MTINEWPTLNAQDSKEKEYEESADPRCEDCGGEKMWCEGCRMWTKTCCTDWGTCMCS